MFPVAFGSLWPNTVAQPSPNLAGFPALNRRLAQAVLSPRDFKERFQSAQCPPTAQEFFFIFFVCFPCAKGKHSAHVFNLEDYYRDLAKWEKQSPIPLVHAWPKPLCEAVESDFVAATASCKIKNANCPIRLASTN